MFSAFTKFLTGPALDALRIREENYQVYIDGLVRDKEKLHLQIKVMGERIREQRKHLRLAAERRGELTSRVNMYQNALNASEQDLRKVTDQLDRIKAKAQKKGAKRGTK